MIKKLTDTGFEGIAYVNVDDTFRSIPVPYEFEENTIYVEKQDTKYVNTQRIEKYVDFVKLGEGIRGDLLQIHSKTDEKGHKVGPFSKNSFEDLMNIPIEYRKQK